MNKEIIARAAEYVKEKFENEYSGHDWFHTLRVFKTATRIAEAEGADLVTVQLAALLHDVDDRKLSPKTYEDKANARTFLSANNVDESKIDEICRIIGEISFAECCVTVNLRISPTFYRFQVYHTVPTFISVTQRT